jgi:hypothetical protein
MTPTGARSLASTAAASSYKADYAGPIERSPC